MQQQALKIRAEHAPNLDHWVEKSGKFSIACGEARQLNLSLRETDGARDVAIIHTQHNEAGAPTLYLNKLELTFKCSGDIVRKLTMQFGQQKPSLRSQPHVTIGLLEDGERVFSCTNTGNFNGNYDGTLEAALVEWSELPVGNFAYRP